jgi:hypothetical protein
MTFALYRGGSWITTPPLHAPALSHDRAQAFPFWDLDDALEQVPILRWAYGQTAEVRALTPPPAPE